jgi:hypothetical protein
MPRRRYLIMYGRSLTLSDWAREYQLPSEALRKRLDRGMTLEQAVAFPVLTRVQCGARAVPSSSWNGRGYFSR